MSEREFIIGTIEWGWCHHCCQDAKTLFILKVYCPHCTIPIHIHLCRRCLRKLVKEGKESLRRGWKRHDEEGARHVECSG